MSTSDRGIPSARFHNGPHRGRGSARYLEARPDDFLRRPSHTSMRAPLLLHVALLVFLATGCDSASDAPAVALHIESRRVVLTTLSADGTATNTVPGLAFDLRNEGTATLSNIAIRLRTDAGSTDSNESVGTLRAFLASGERATVPVPAVLLDRPDFRCYRYSVEYVVQPRDASATREQTTGGTCPA